MVSRTRLKAGEFLQLPESNQPTELINGEVIVSPAPLPLHQRVSGRLYTLLHGLIPGGELFYAPIDAYFDEDNLTQPDILWIGENSRCKVMAQWLEGPPDLIVEIFSPGTAKRDKKEKYRLYEKYGVREYWMVDPVGQYVEVCVWKDGSYIQQGVYGPDDSFESPVLGGKRVDLKAVFA